MAGEGQHHEAFQEILGKTYPKGRTCQTCGMQACHTRSRKFVGVGTYLLLGAFWLL